MYCNIYFSFRSGEFASRGWRTDKLVVCRMLFHLQNLNLNNDINSKNQAQGQASNGIQEHYGDRFLHKKVSKYEGNCISFHFT